MVDRFILGAASQARARSGCARIYLLSTTESLVLGLSEYLMKLGLTKNGSKAFLMSSALAVDMACAWPCSMSTQVDIRQKLKQTLDGKHVTINIEKQQGQ